MTDAVLLERAKELLIHHTINTRNRLPNRDWYELRDEWLIAYAQRGHTQGGHMKPATPLSWKSDPRFDLGIRGANGDMVDQKGFWKQEDHSYIIAACNAYPKLLAFVKEYDDVCFSHDSGSHFENCHVCKMVHTKAELLKELDE